MQIPWMIVAIAITTTLLSVWQQQLVLCKSLMMMGSSSSPKQLLQNSAMALLKNHLIDQKATTRGVTSSQVIEYNARNIVLMTLLNSVLILGGLLGSFNQRPDIGAAFMQTPFKRIDLSSIKKRFGKKRNHQRYRYHHHPHTHHNNHRPGQLIDPIMMIEGLESVNQPIGIKSSMTNELIQMPGATDTIEYEIYPRQMSTVGRKNNPHQQKSGGGGHRRNDQSDDDGDDDGQSGAKENCALVIQCKDSSNGKFYYPSLSSLTKIAVQLLNEETERTNRKPKALMLDKVKQMIEIEQNSKDSCHWKHLCQLDR